MGGHGRGGGNQGNLSRGGKVSPGSGGHRWLWPSLCAWQCLGQGGATLPARRGVPRGCGGRRPFGADAIGTRGCWKPPARVPARPRSTRVRPRWSTPAAAPAGTVGLRARDRAPLTPPARAPSGTPRGGTDTTWAPASGRVPCLRSQQEPQHSGRGHVVRVALGPARPLPLVAPVDPRPVGSRAANGRGHNRR